MKRRRRLRSQEDAGEAGRNRRPHASVAQTPTANAVAGKCADTEQPAAAGAMRGTLARRGAEIAGLPANEGTLDRPGKGQRQSAALAVGVDPQATPCGATIDALAGRVVGLSKAVRFERFNSEKWSVERMAYPRTVRSPAPLEGSMPEERRTPPGSKTGGLPGVSPGGDCL